MDYYVARFYDPLTAHFTQADTLIPEPGKASSFDRYAYVRNNPVRYNDPSGHKDSGECGPGEDCEESEEEEAESKKNALLNKLKDEEQNGCMYGGCDKGEEIAKFAIISLLSITAAEGLVAGEISLVPAIETINYKVLELGAKCTANNACLAILNSIIGVVPKSNPQSNPALPRTSNEIGTWGVQQAERSGLISAKQIIRFDPVTGQKRIFDGISNASNAFVEIKTTTTGTIFATKFIKNQINFDANFGQSVEWIFINGAPSGPLKNLMGASNIPWSQVNIP